MQSAFTRFVARSRRNYGEVEGAVDNRKTSRLAKVLEERFEHDPEKWKPVFPTRSCSTKETRVQSVQLETIAL
jgi:hypothetical protein